MRTLLGFLVCLACCGNPDSKINGAWFGSAVQNSDCAGFLETRTPEEEIVVVEGQTASLMECSKITLKASAANLALEKTTCPAFQDGDEPATYTIMAGQLQLTGESMKFNFEASVYFQAIGGTCTITENGTLPPLGQSTAPPDQ